MFEIFRMFFHYGLHYLFPIAIAKKIHPEKWKKTYLILVLTNLVDLDHLLSDPIFDPHRLSIGHHILHSYIAIFLYIILLAFPKMRIVALGLLLHMLTDFVDYLVYSLST